MRSLRNISKYVVSSANYFRFLSVYRIPAINQIFQPFCIRIFRFVLIALILPFPMLTAAAQDNTEVKSHDFPDFQRRVEITNTDIGDYRYRAVISVFDTDRDEPQILHETTIGPNIMSGQYRLAVFSTGSPGFAVIAAAKEFYILELSSGRISPKQGPRFPDGSLMDSQSGNMSNFRIDSSGQFITGDALDMGRFTYDLSSPLQPIQIITPALPAEYWENLHSVIFVDRIIKSGIELDRRYDGSTLLIGAVDAGNIAVIARLLRAGASAESWSSRDSALSRAITTERKDIVYLLLDAGAYPRASDLLIELYGADNPGVAAVLFRRQNPPTTRPSELLGMKSADEMNSIGLDFHRQGRYENSLEYFTYASMKEPDSARGFFNQACALSLMGRIDEAVARLVMAAVIDAEWVAGYIGDPDLSPLHETAGFRQIAEMLDSIL